MEPDDIVIGRISFLPHLLYMILLVMVLGGGEWLIYDAHDRSFDVLFHSSDRTLAVFIGLLPGFCLILLIGIPLHFARQILINNAVLVVRNGSVIVPMSLGWPDIPLVSVTHVDVTGSKFLPFLVLRRQGAAETKMAAWAVEPEAAQMAETLNALIAAAKTGGR